MYQFKNSNSSSNKSSDTKWGQPTKRRTPKYGTSTEDRERGRGREGEMVSPMGLAVGGGS